MQNKMCKTSKMCKNKMCKNSIWDLINSNINKRDERDLQTGCTGYVHIAAIRMMRIWMCFVFCFFLCLVNVYETEFVLRSLMAWGKKLLLSLSVFAIMLLKRLPDGSKQKRWLPGWVESLRILAALLLQRLR